MNIIDFLIDNYIWILVIILVTIVTIIGFLADKKKGSNNNQQNQNVGSGQPVSNNTMIYQQPMQPPQNQMNNINNMGVNYNGMNTPLNQMPPQNPGMVNGQQFDGINNQNMVIPEPEPVAMTSNIPEPINQNPQLVDNVTPNVSPEPMMYQPLSEQKPVIPPQPVLNFQESPVMNNNNQVLPQNGFNGNEIITNSNIVPNKIGIGTMNQNTVVPQTPETAPVYNNTTQIPQQIDNNGMASNYTQGTGTIPQPVNPIPVPQPVIPQPIMNNAYNQQGNVNQGYQQPMVNSNVIPQQNQQPVLNTQQQPVNFVFGPQNNNQNM